MKREDGMTFSQRVRLSRRALLRGAGAAVALPALEAMQAHAAAAPPVRFVGFSFENGVHPAIWTPAKTGPDYALTAGLQPLEPVKGHVNVLSGLHQRWVGDGGHGPGLHAGITGHPSRLIARETNVGRVPSLEQVIGQRVGATTRFPAVVVSPGPGGSSRSWQGPNRPSPVVQGPRALFDMFFPSPEARAAAAARSARTLKLVDHVRDDVKRLQPRLGTVDRARLDQHLTALDELQRDLGLPPPDAACGATTFETLQAATSSKDQALKDQTLRVLTLAMACDLTRSALVVFGYVGSAVKNGVTYNDHQASHTQELDVIGAITRQKTQLVATAAQLMKDTPDGQTSLLRNAVVLTFWDVADGNKHNYSNLPLLMAGNAGGRVTTGQHLRLSDVSVNRLYSSILGWMGSPSSFGIDDSAPLAGLGS